jgi:alpha-tubulin suppressor-like RCC1 family protein
VTIVAGGGAHTCAATASGLKCWGDGAAGQLGDAMQSQHSTPVSAVGIGVVTSIGAGALHTCAAGPDEGLRCWGYNSDGQLGDGQDCGTVCATPVIVPGVESATLSVDAGEGHTCAVFGDGSDGGAQCWGRNDLGQLGDGLLCGNPCTTLQPVSGLSSGIVAVAVGGSFSCALTSVGGVKCWGQNNLGQLGDGQTCGAFSCSTPVDVSGLSSGIIAISAGLDHACAVTATATLKCWGENSNGQLGDGQVCGTGACTIPVDVAGLTSVQAVAAGGFHTCALHGTGGVSCWGRNLDGQLGDGTNMQRTSPVAVSLPAAATAIGAGSYHSCAATAEGLRCWGLNNYGQLGDGSQSNRNAPVAVKGLGATGDDWDGDGCPDKRELGADELLGGRRDPIDFWDFFNTPDAANLRDQQISIADITRLLPRFASVGDPGIDPLSAPGPAPAYHTAYDRTPVSGGEQWQTGPPNGSVTITDITLMVQQFSHSCA